MYRICALLLLLCLILANVALGQSFLLKDYTQWTASEVQKVLTDSPWAAEVRKVMSMAVLMESRQAGDSGTGPRVVAPRASTGNSSGQGGGIEITLRISWQSALPVRRALVRSRLGSATAPIAVDVQEYLQKDPADYVVLVTGMPIRQARAIELTAAKKKCSLHAGKSPEIIARSLELQNRNETVDVLLTFPRSRPIKLEDDEVEVQLTLGPVEVKKKFKLKNMVYDGKLEL